MTETTDSANRKPVAIAALVVTLCGTAFAGMAWLYEQRLSSISEKYEATLALERQKFHDELRSARSVRPETTTALSAASSSKSSSDGSEQPPAVNRTAEPGAKTQAKSYGEVFRPSDPFPKGFDANLMGMQLSQLKIKKPGGKVSRDSYDVAPTSGPFSLVIFATELETPDPKVTSITFYYRDEQAFKHVKADAAQKFLGLNVQRRMDGDAFVATVNGIKADLNPEWYSLDPTR